GLDGGDLGHLMPVWLGIVALQGVLTARTLHGLNRDNRIDILDGHEGPRLSWMARLSPALPSARHTAGAWLQDMGGITRRRPRGVMRVLPEALQQALDGGLQLGNACFEGADILSNGKGRLLPQLRWERWCGMYGP